MRRTVNGPARRAWAAGLLCLAFAAVCAFAPDLIYDARAAQVNVRWAPQVDAGRRSALETRYRLTRAVHREGATWAYYLADPSKPNVRALVTDPAVEDTHYINRSRFTVWRSAARDPYRGRGASVVSWLSPLLSWLLVLAAAGFAFVAVAPASARALGPRLRLVTSSAGRWVTNLAPPGTAVAVAAFRVLLGACLLVMVWRNPISGDLATRIVASSPVAPGFGWLWRVLESAPAVATWAQTLLELSLLAFIVGIGTRAAYAASYAGLWLWALLHVARSSMHPYSAMLVGATALLAAPWGDAVSIDAWLRRRAGGSRPARAPSEYGYVMWIPGVVLGLCFLAAAVAKLREGGLAWITNGTVKYHFLTDSPNALVDWGLWLGRHDTAAVVVSGASVVVEGIVIVGALARDYRLRACAGLLSVGIFTGFALLQGLFWPGWWVLTLSFLPWHRLADVPADPTAVVRRSWLQYAQAAILLALVSEQALVSTFKLEVPPVFSTYEMYSTSYGSPADYELGAGMSYWLVGRERGGAERPCEVWRAAAEAWMDPVRRAADRDAQRAVAACFGDVPVETLRVEGRRTRVDWDRWRLAGEEHVELTGSFPLPLAASAGSTRAP